MSVIRGENAILYWKVDGYYKPVACMVSCNVTTNAELAETSTVQSGTFRTYRGNRNTWTVSCQGLVSFDTNHPHVKLRQLQQSFTAIPISFTATDENGISSTFSGKVLITSMPDDASASDFYTYSIEATGTGKYKITDVPVDPNECCQDDWIYYTGIGTEGSSIVIAALIGKQIAGRIYRDGFEYRPSGADHDGKGVPVGKQFSYDDQTGTIGFDTSLVGIASGEQIDIPYNLCGSSATCDIEISDVMPVYDAYLGLFKISFLPIANNVITAPDDVMVRYSTDGGATWTDAYNIAYDPDVNYQLVTINDLLDPEQTYLFEVTPICNGAAGTPDTGLYSPCVPVAIEETILPAGQVGIPYSVDIPLTGTQPFVLSGPVGPLTGWMTFAVNADHVELRGTPDAIATDAEIEFHISNCEGNNSDDFAGTLDVTGDPTNTDVSNERADVNISDVLFDGSVCTPYEDIPVANGDTGRATIPTAISSKITVRLSAVPLTAIHLEITKNGVVQETVTIASPVTIVIVSANNYSFITADTIELRVY